MAYRLLDPCSHIVSYNLTEAYDRHGPTPVLHSKEQTVGCELPKQAEQGADKLQCRLWSAMAMRCWFWVDLTEMGSSKSGRSWSHKTFVVERILL
jgi:hypothetical protein